MVGLGVIEELGDFVSEKDAGAELLFVHKFLQLGLLGLAAR